MKSELNPMMAKTSCYRFSLVFATFFLFTFLASHANANGLLKVHPINPLYFTDNTGKAIYLGGHQMFNDLQDNTFGKFVTYNNQSTLDWNWYIQFLKSRNLNYIRNWTEMSTGCGSPTLCAIASPMPYKRVSGVGNANDGGLKFDLNQFDQSFFDRMRSRIIDLGKNGIYISIMLYDVYAFSNFPPSSDAMWMGNIFNSANNVNGIDVDTNGDGWGVEFFTALSTQITALQNSYVKKVIDTVNDLDNVIFEIANEVGDINWQSDMLNTIKTYEASKPKQHLIYLSPGGLSGAGTYTLDTQNQIVSSQANMFSVALGWGDYFDDPPTNTSGKPGVLDRDHVDALGGPQPLLPWKAFTRGYHFNLYDNPFEQPSNESSAWELARKNIGAIVSFANTKFSDLSRMVPNGSLSSTGYVLANPGSEYLILQPGSGSFTANLLAGTYSYEWFNPNTALSSLTGSTNASVGNNIFTPPFSGSAVLYLKLSPF